ncbi:MAG: phosphatidylserine synthase [Bacteroidota bacterium]|jgi:CDP-diacylglycerol--serine O-phosphatidyltransferase|nr:phosphatidylserine synthase [Bacteroidota bacterium]
MKIKKHIPNAITCLNLFCGCLAIVAAFENHLQLAAYLVGLAAIFDFCDGFAARMLRVTSTIGKDLDSLADMVTFGVVPGIVVFHYLEAIEGSMVPYTFILTDYSWINYIAFLLVIFSAVRLAKFNNDPRQSDSFIGLPTPANAIFWCSLIFLEDSPVVLSLINPYSMIVGVILFSVLLISEIPLFALKFRHFGWRGNRIRFSFLALSVLVLILLQETGVPLIIILYLVFSIIVDIASRRKRVPRTS